MALENVPVHVGGFAFERGRRGAVSGRPVLPSTTSSASTVLPETPLRILLGTSTVGAGHFAHPA